MPRAALVGVVVAVAVFAALMVADGGNEAPRPTTAGASAAPRGLAVFTEMGCGSCHRLAAARSTGRFGPDLDERLAGHTRTSLRRKITDPGATERYTGMPEDFGRRMSRAELGALVDFLLAARAPARR